LISQGTFQGMEYQEKGILTLYRWQFLRRNPRYRKDYHDLAKRLKKDPKEFHQQYHPVWLAMYMVPWAKVLKEYPNLDLKFIKKCFIELGRFKEKWAVSTPTHPKEVEAPDFMDFLVSSPLRGMPIEIISPLIKGEGQEGDISSPARWGDNSLHVRINLLSSQKEILRHFEEILNIAQKMAAENQFGDLKDPKWAKWDEYLRIYDEVCERGKNIEQVAKDTDPELENKTPQEKEKILSRLQDLLSEAKKIIEIGFFAKEEKPR